MVRQVHLRGLRNSPRDQAERDSLTIFIEDGQSVALGVVGYSLNHEQLGWIRDCQQTKRSMNTGVELMGCSNRAAGCLLTRVQWAAPGTRVQHPAASWP